MKTNKKLFYSFIFWFGFLVFSVLNVSGDVCYCDSCADCTEKLNNSNCMEVKLISNLTINHFGACGDDPANFNNKIFDCQGFAISAEDKYSSTTLGIKLRNKQNNIIKNCIFTNLYYGIDLYSSSNNTFINNTNSNNYYGIYLEGSSNNIFTNNSIKENLMGDIIFFVDSASDCNNIFENNIGSGDRPIKFFNSSVNLQNEVLSELMLCNADNSNINNVTIMGSDSLQNNGLLVFFTDNSNFTNINSSNNSFGARLHSSSNNSLINNNLSSNWWAGIYLSSSSNNILTNNNASSNYIVGISLSSSNNTILANNTVNSNGCSEGGVGIFLDSSSNNTITNNTVNSNTDYGIYLQISSNNTIVNNTVSSNSRGIYLCGNSNFNNILNNEILSNNETGIMLFNCHGGEGAYLGGNTNNCIEYNKILNNKIGIYSDSSNSTINKNIVCGNTNFDFNSNNWQSSTGDNNTCSKPDGWNDTLKTGCSYTCLGVLTYTILLNTGWNLVSIPITPKNPSINSVLSSVDGKYTKVGARVNGSGKHYIPGFPFNTLNEINEKMGFWIKMNQTATLTVEGYTPADREITLQTGWNLVGYLSTNKNQPLAAALSSISGKYTKVGAWINGTGKHYIPGFPFNTLINMSEGYGYWIKMNSTGVLAYT